MTEFFTISSKFCFLSVLQCLPYLAFSTKVCCASTITYSGNNISPQLQDNEQCLTTPPLCFFLICKNPLIPLHCIVLVINDLGVSVTILLQGVDSGQTSTKYRDLACDVEPRPLKNSKDLTMKFKVKYLFPRSSSSASFIYQLPEVHGVMSVQSPT